MPGCYRQLTFLMDKDLYQLGERYAREQGHKDLEAFMTVALDKALMGLSTSSRLVLTPAEVAQRHESRVPGAARV